VALPIPAPGLVIRFGYVWKREAAAGRESGAKDRPCVVVLAVEAVAGRQVVTVVPITHRQPDDDDGGVALLERVQSRLGLDTEPAWVVVSEVNRFIWPGPDLRPISPDKPDTFAYGFLPRELLTDIRDKMVAWHGTRRVSIVRRES
jgi:hypothetical protein